MRVKNKAEKSAVVMFFKNASGENLDQESDAVNRILKVSPDARELNVVFGSVPEDDRELAIQMRSMLQIIVELASHIDVPQEDVAQGRVYSAPIAAPPDFPDLINIHKRPGTPDRCLCGHELSRPVVLD